MQQLVLALVSGNASWWKSRKYRKETARTLKAYKREGWRLAGIERLAVGGVDTRLRTAYHLMRSTSADSASMDPASSARAALAEEGREGEGHGEGRSHP